MRLRHTPSPVVLALLLAGLIQLPAAAQTNAPAEPEAEAKKKAEKEAKPAQLDTVIVTSSKRRELAHRLPYNVTAIGEQALREANITDPKRLIANSPSIEAPPNSARFSDSITVRGLNISSVSANNIEWFARSTLSTYLDDAMLPAVGFRIKDIARVETLLGPQGTLYGGGALGGAVRYITHKPQLGKFEGQLNTSFFQVKHGSLSNDTDGVLNAPLGEDLALRISLARLDDRGYTDRYAGTPSYLTSTWTPKHNADQVLYKDDDWYRADTARVSLLWRATPALELRLTHGWQDSTAHGTSGGQLLPASGSPARYAAPPAWDRQTVLSPYPEYTDRRIALTTIDLDWRLDGLGQLHSSTSRFKDSRVGQGDYLGTGSFFYGDLGYSRYRLGAPNFAGQTAYMTYDNRNEGVLHETRLVSEPGVLSWIAGLFLSSQEKSQQYSEWMPTLPSSGRPGEGYLEDQRSKYRERALFGELSWKTTEKLTLTAGARLFAYQDDSSTQVEDYAFDLVTGTIKGREKDSGQSYFKLNANYALTNDLLAYATLSQGFRRGGANGFRGVGDQAVNPALQGYRPDRTDNFEIGAKGFLLDRQLYLQADVYQIDWKDPQTYFSQDIQGFPVWGTTNGPKARTRGFEMQLRWLPVAGLELGLSSSYTEGEWAGTKEVCLYADGTECRTYRKGGQLGGTAPWKHALNARWSRSFDTPWGDSDVYVAASANYLGLKASDRGDDPEDKPFEYKAYTTYRLSTGLSQSNWDLSLWVDNLTNERELVSFQGTSAVASRVGLRGIYLTPRTVGLNLGWRF